LAVAPTFNAAACFFCFICKRAGDVLINRGDFSLLLPAVAGAGVSEGHLAGDVLLKIGKYGPGFSDAVNRVEK